MIKDFTDLTSWQSAHILSLELYALTSKFPVSEQYGLSSQMKRAAVSVTSNIAEGFGRSSKNDKSHFYTMASGSLYELKSQAILARDLAYISDKDYNKLLERLDLTHKLLNGLIKKHNSSV